MQGDGGRELVERAQAGDRQAFAELYAAHHDTVFRFVRYRVGHRQLAEDITADVWVRALARIGTWVWAGKPFGAWLMTLARNAVADHFKKAETRRTAPVDMRVLPGEWGDARRHADVVAGMWDDDPEVDPQRVAERAELAAVLSEELSALTRPQREVLWLRFWGGRSVRETAAQMGLEEGAAKALQYRATQRLAGLLPAGYRRSA